MNPTSLVGERLAHRRAQLNELPPLRINGRLRRITGLTLEAEGCFAPIGTRCLVTHAGNSVEAEVVGFADERLFLMPIHTTNGLRPHARVIPVPSAAKQVLSDRLLGRVIDGRGEPLDSRGPIQGGVVRTRSQTRRPISPLTRAPISEPLDVGVRSINALLTLGRGQRVGLFAGSGVGKSMLLGMVTRHTQADVVVVGLIGERGREVSEFVAETLGPETMRKAVVVATPADDAPLMRSKGAWLATEVAEYFRDKGKNVLLLMDSLTRFAQAQREIGLAIGEPPTTKGYPPSVFAQLPALVERAGNGSPDGGSITGIYTVLAEGDDPNDPVVDAARAILDGHLVLSRSLAEEGVFPAIDIEASVSRSMHRLLPEAQLQAVSMLREIYASYHRNIDLIRVGAYQPGSDPELDAAVELYPRIREFLRQPYSEACTFEQAGHALAELLSVTPAQSGDVLPASA